MAKVYKNDVFEVLKQLDNKNYQYFDTLTEEQKKDIQPYTLLRWMSVASGNESVHQNITMLANNNVNKHFWELSKYKDLQWKLLCTCGQKKWTKHQWLPMSKTTTDKNYKIAREFYKDMAEEDFNIVYKTLVKSDIDEISKFLGLKDK